MVIGVQIMTNVLTSMTKITMEIVALASNKMKMNAVLALNIVQMVIFKNVPQDNAVQALTAVLLVQQKMKMVIGVPVMTIALMDMIRT